MRWLNGMVTNNIRDLAVGHGVYAFLLNPQGHILGDLYAYNRGESITVDTDRGQAEKILATFDHYIIMDDVEVTNLSEQMTALGIAGPKSHDVLAAAGFAVPETAASAGAIRCDWQGDLSARWCAARTRSTTSYEIWMAPDSVRQLWDALLAAGATPVGSEALELHRIVSGIPRYGVDIRERDLPQETEQARALNFNKGCYVGQEIVERIRSRGAVHRKFTGFLAEGARADCCRDQDCCRGEGSRRDYQRRFPATAGGAEDCGAGIHSARSGCAGTRGHDWLGEGDRGAVASYR